MRSVGLACHRVKGEVRNATLMVTPPTQIGAGETLQLQLKLVPAVQTRAVISAAPDDYRYGNAS